MKRLLTDAKIGDIYIRSDGKLCIYVAKDNKSCLYKYRFRLLEEHIKREQELNEYPTDIKLTDWLYHSSQYYGDWCVKASGYSTAGGRYWKNNLDIINKYEKI